MRRLFYPTQDKHSFTKIPDLYREFLPAPPLRRYIACYWMSDFMNHIPSVSASGDPKINRVVPDGCVDFVFQINRRTGRYHVDAVGMMNRPIFVSTSKDIVHFGIRFFPAGAYPFLKIPLGEITDRNVHLADVNRVFAPFSDIMAAAVKPLEKVAVADKYLAVLLDSKGSPASNLANLLSTIYQAKGMINISELAASEFISERHLNRLFTEQIGVSPKRFCRVIRFQNILRAVNTSLNFEGLNFAFDYGYFDQAHFINDFKSLYGATPGMSQTP